MTLPSDAKAPMLTLYPELPKQRRATIARDLGVVAALVLFAVVAGRVYSSVQDLKPLGGALSAVGSQLPGGGGGMVHAAAHYQARVHDLALTLAAATMALPSALLLWWYAPRRIGQVRRLSAASLVLAGAPARELATRAALSLPYAQLLSWTDDPLGDLAAGRYDGLLAAAFDDLGLQWGAEAHRKLTGPAPSDRRLPGRAPSDP